VCAIIVKARRTLMRYETAHRRDFKNRVTTRGLNEMDRKNKGKGCEYRN
jgi:hypothetical protein